MLKLLGGTGLFALFGWSAGRARERWGFAPSIVALLWVGLEIGLTKLGFAHGFFGEPGLSHPLLHGLIGLFGFLTVSAIIVLLNSLLVLAIIKTLQLARSGGGTIQEDKEAFGLLHKSRFFPQRVYFVPGGRAPPA